MMNVNFKTIGSLLVAFSLILIFILTFVKINVDKEGAFLCKVVDESPDLTMDQCPAHNTPNSWLILVAFAISFLVLGAGVYMIFFPHSEQKTEVNGAVNGSAQPAGSSVDPSQLDEEERKIFDLLTLKEGSAYQSDLIKETGMTKVKMSRILDKLEGKHVLERKRRGMTNIVVLK